jgi:hypothetical protein
VRQRKNKGLETGGAGALPPSSPGRLVLAASGESPHSTKMANRNVFAIAGIAIFLMVGVVVAIGIAGAIFMVLYGIVVLIFHSAFGIELPHLF